ncbi:threonine synthase [Pseudoduganella violaceinigra]|uniref:threonine synthase n=1 Tax=Pseudoduganella violaceinigra TaxID=246602 RepID=UPI000429CC2A|nr:threonine synthase [Pseudoduganella violaceinigra]
MSTEPRYFLRCLQCDSTYAKGQVGYCCPICELDGALDVLYDYERIGRSFRQDVARREAFDMWRYRSILPISDDFRPALHTGGSPLYEMKHDGQGCILVKDDSRNPSGSLKDRASALAVALAAGMGADTIATASTGNAAAALACMSAISGMQCKIFAPANAPREKLAQMRTYGASVIAVEGGYDEAFEACYAACKEYGWYNRSTGINSFMSEGKKTVAFEICEQMQWRVPDRVYVPVGNGCIVGAVYKGFKELHQMGCTDRIPRIMGVQASGSDFMFRAWRAGAGPNGATAQPANTAAGSISVALPRDRIKALRAIEKSGGEFITVSDTEIFQAVTELARNCGVFAEAGAAAAYAGAKKCGAHGRSETSVVLVTGSGLKDIAGLLKSGVLADGAELLRQRLAA